MLAHQERVVQEKQELDDKIAKLSSFTNPNNDIFNALPEDEQVRLGRQLAVMAEYSSILSERINAFPPPPQTIIQ